MHVLEPARDRRRPAAADRRASSVRSMPAACSCGSRAAIASRTMRLICCQPRADVVRPAKVSRLRTMPAARLALSRMARSSSVSSDGRLASPASTRRSRARPAADCSARARRPTPAGRPPPASRAAPAARASTPGPAPARISARRDRNSRTTTTMPNGIIIASATRVRSDSVAGDTVEQPPRDLVDRRNRDQQRDRDQRHHRQLRQRRRLFLGLEQLLVVGHRRGDRHHDVRRHEREVPQPARRVRARLDRRRRRRCRRANVSARPAA